MLNLKDYHDFERIETPFYYYDIELFHKTVDFVSGLSKKYGIDVHYSIKANSERRLMEILSANGFGAECVGGNEVVFAHDCGFAADKIMFAGVGKTDTEIMQALNIGIQSFNCESLHEVKVIEALAAKYHKVANIALRINPNIDAHTHKYITTGLYEDKFGISKNEFDAAIALIKSCNNLNFRGLHFHIGSQITRVDEVFCMEAEKANEIVEYFESRGLKVDNIDLGGGLGVDYDDPDGNPMPDFETWFKAISETIRRRPEQTVNIEPGRAIVAQCGSLISRVLYLKRGEAKNFLILDAGMNDLIRPALYGAYHKIENLTAWYRRREETKDCAYDVVGPICESSDVWGEGRVLRMSIRGDIMAIRSAGAYGHVMASRYNLKNLAPAVWSDRLGGAPQRALYYGADYYSAETIAVPRSGIDTK